VYLPDHEKRLLVRTVRRLSAEARRQVGRWPATVTIDLEKDDFGGKQQVVFLLIKDEEGLAYEVMGKVEVDGVPNGTLRVRVDG